MASSKPASDRLSPRIVDAVFVVAAMWLIWVVSGSLDTRAALDTDVVNLAFAIDRFDLAAHQPHPPGYLGYVLVLRAVDAVGGLAPLDTVKLVGRAFTLLAVFLIYLAGRAMAPQRRAVALLAVAFAATNPVLLYYAVDGQTHAAEGAVGGALLWLLILARQADAPRLRSAVIIGLLLAVGGSFRPSFVLVAVGPVLWCYWRRWPQLAVVGGVAALGTSAWLVPTVVMTGGWTAYQTASDALIGAFARSTSVLSEQGDGRMIADNVRSLAIWGGLIVGVPAIAACVATWRDDTRTAYWFLLLTAVPALAFYAVMFIAEAGYVLGILAAACVAAAMSLGDSPALWKRGAAGALAVGQFAFFLAAPSAPDASHWWIPSVAEIVFRQESAELIMERIAGDADPSERLLVITDRGSATLFRQVPVLRPNTHVLTVNSDRLALFDYTTLSLATEDNWLAAPGPALLANGPPTTLTVDVAYDRVVIGPTYTDELRAELAAQTECDVPAPSRELIAPHLSVAQCFPGAELSFSPHRLRWRRK